MGVMTLTRQIQVSMAQDGRVADVILPRRQRDIQPKIEYEMGGLL